MRLFRAVRAPGGWAVAIILQVSSVFAADTARISINNDWRFIKSDPAGITDNLTYPRAPRGRRGAAPTNAPAPNSGIAQYILPTGNSLIADPAKRYPKPDGNYGGGHSVCESIL